jgi:sugar phosphate isomerase/epimerase
LIGRCYRLKKEIVVKTERRTFMKTIAAAAFAGGSGLALAQAPAASKIQLGICSSPNRAEQLKEAGFEYIEGGVSSILKPDASDADYAPEIEKLRGCALPIRACNGFIPGHFALTGPETRHDAALEYAATACRRADAVGVSYIVLGSGKARRVPDGFDGAKARAQFVEFCRKLGERIQDLKVTVVLEPLNRSETNLLNSVIEGIAYVNDIGHPRIQLLADFYHMMRESEGPDAIRQAGARILHCHIAEHEGRKAPGTKGEDLSGYFKALKEISYSGGVSCECGWPKENLQDAWKKAVAIMRAQMA